MATSPNASNSSIPQSTLTVLAELEKSFLLDDDKLRAIVEQFLKDFKLGLGTYGESMAMIPTFVTGTPNGTEKGTFLALDLGGTNLRVCQVQLHGDHTYDIQQQKYRVSDALKTGEATALFDYIAECVDTFLTGLKDFRIAGEYLHLGMTFSFPVEQTAIDKGKLLTWTKGFSAKNAIDNDVVQLLQDAFNRKHIHVRVTALVNDTVGTLLSRAYLTGGCILGAIFGTGTNGAYVEDVKTIAKLAGSNNPAVPKEGKMIVNCEWGAFDNSRNVLPVTPFDNKVDRESINPRYQCFEKFISGMYLGEITRNLLLYLVDSLLLFNGHSTKQLNTHYGFDTALMSEIELDTTVPVPNATVQPQSLGATPTVNGTQPRSFTRTRGVLTRQLGFKPEFVTDIDCEIVQWACRVVATRAAKCSGCAVAAIIKQTGADKDTGVIPVGVDGSMAEHYPLFEVRLREALIVLVGEEVEKRVEIGLAKDGSGVGAALCALQAAKQEVLPVPLI
ncbi:hypothetical protein BOTBODRAFT_192701 [Botryobasidium botryosum FD-172 SS1]|uniref:Phosphotransferase n=1 Tax=Botryobasidium botryosum (strain FD-172 SS1) TaxID=930990 RepID=A0A067LXF8_BOTB1|nr:hypothetical protein BOTBODRAFT_192701 [Botryobasidium botryosum FD-172 SS1]